MERSDTRGVRDWSNSAPFNDPVSSLVAQHGPNGQQQQIGEWTNAELNTAVASSSKPRPTAPRARAFRRHAGDRRARGPGLHGAAPERDVHGQAEVASSGRRRRPSRWISGPAILERLTDAAPLRSTIAESDAVAFDGVHGAARRRPHGRQGEALGLVGESGSRQVRDLACGARPAAGNGAGRTASVTLDGAEHPRRARPRRSTACAAAASR